MQFLLGVGVSLLIFIAFYLGYRAGHKKPEIPEDQKQKVEQMRREFNEIVNYNLDKALRGKEGR